jgi:DNA-binding Xre family transcriptional regulator
MRDAYSRLSFILAARGLTLAALRERLRAQGDPLDSKTLARLANPDRPIKQVETRVADALCRALAIDLTELIAFAPPLAPRLRELTPDQQTRLTALLALHTEGTLPPDALPELEALVAEADENELHNVRLLAAHRERLRAAPTDQRHSAAD